MGKYKKQEKNAVGRIVAQMKGSCEYVYLGKI